MLELQINSVFELTSNSKIAAIQRTSLFPLPLSVSNQCAKHIMAHVIFGLSSLLANFIGRTLR